MQLLDEFVLQVRRQSCDVFVAEMPGFFLIASRQSDELSQDWLFNTQTISQSKGTLVRSMIKEGYTLHPDTTKNFAFPVKKCAQNPWPDRIMIGRASNNDLVLSDASVSKVHAFLTYEKNSGKLKAHDAGSLNGIQHNEHLVAPGGSADIQSHDYLEIGVILLKVLAAKDFFDFVHGHIKHEKT